MPPQGHIPSTILTKFRGLWTVSLSINVFNGHIFLEIFSAISGKTICQVRKVLRFKHGMDVLCHMPSMMGLGLRTLLKGSSKKFDVFCLFIALLNGRVCGCSIATK